MQSSQLFCRERLGPVTSAWRKRYHLCKQVILICLPVLWMGNFARALRQCFCYCFCILVPAGQFRGFFQFLLLPVIFVHLLPGLIARIQGG